jgi:hypothetical protein
VADAQLTFAKHAEFQRQAEAAKANALARLAEDAQARAEKATKAKKAADFEAFLVREGLARERKDAEAEKAAEAEAQKAAEDETMIDAPSLQNPPSEEEKDQEMDEDDTSANQPSFDPFHGGNEELSAADIETLKEIGSGEYPYGGCWTGL